MTARHASTSWFIIIQPHAKNAGGLIKITGQEYKLSFPYNMELR